jgi:hypothetical protein
MSDFNVFDIWSVEGFLCQGSEVWGKMWVLCYTFDVPHNWQSLNLVIVINEVPLLLFTVHFKLYTTPATDTTTTTTTTNTTNTNTDIAILNM